MKQETVGVTAVRPIMRLSGPPRRKLSTLKGLPASGDGAVACPDAVACSHGGTRARFTEKGDHHGFATLVTCALLHVTAGAPPAAAGPVAPRCYMLKRWPSFTRFLRDGRICLTNNAAERSLRGIAVGRKAWLFAGSDRGGERAAAMYSLIVTARLNDVDPRAWLADVIARIADHPVRQLYELLPWNWRDPRTEIAAAA